MRGEIRVVLSAETSWIARCVDFDYSGEGKSINDALEVLRQKILSDLNGKGLRPLKNEKLEQDFLNGPLLRDVIHLDSDFVLWMAVSVRS